MLFESKNLNIVTQSTSAVLWVGHHRDAEQENLERK